MQRAVQDQRIEPAPGLAPGAAVAHDEDAAVAADRMSPLAGLGWGFSGFVIGAVFWHFIGFWGFIEKVVYNGRTDDASHYVAQTGSDCTTLVLDRQSGATVATPCDADMPLLNEHSITARGDFLGGRIAPVAKSSPRQLRLVAGD